MKEIIKLRKAKGIDIYIMKNFVKSKVHLRNSNFKKISQLYRGQRSSFGLLEDFVLELGRMRIHEVGK